MTRAEVESAKPRWKQVSKNIIEAACLDTFIISLDARDASLTDAIKTHGYWEAWITAWHTEHVKPGSLYIDGGANCGYYTFLAAYLGAQAWAFEPNPRYVELLTKSRADMGNSEHINIGIWERALSDKNGSAHLNFFGDLDGSASIMADTGDSIEVPTLKLDSLIDHHISGNDHDIILKLDIEGAEELALRGAVNLIAKHNVTIILEYTPGAYSDDFWNLLESIGTIQQVGFDGKEYPITREDAESRTDWLTLVLRKYKLIAS